MVTFWNWTTHDAVSFYTSVLAIFTAVLGSVTDAKILHANDEYKSNFRIEFKNYGQTPAYRVINKCKTSLSIAGKPNFQDIEEKTTHYSDLGPSQDKAITVLIMHSVWNEVIKPAIKVGLPFYVYGEITYFGAFQDRATASPRLTRYRFEVHLEDGEVCDGGLFFSEEGNEAN